MSLTHCDTCGSYAGGCLCEDAIELEKELRGLKGALFLAVQRLGGRVEFSPNEIAELTETGDAWALVSWTDPATLAVVVESRKPTKEQQ